MDSSVPRGNDRSRIGKPSACLNGVRVFLISCGIIISGSGHPPTRQSLVRRDFRLAFHSMHGPSVQFVASPMPSTSLGERGGRWHAQNQKKSCPGPSSSLPSTAPSSGFPSSSRGWRGRCCLFHSSLWYALPCIHPRGRDKTAAGGVDEERLCREIMSPYYSEMEGVQKGESRESWGMEVIQERR